MNDEYQQRQFWEEPQKAIRAIIVESNISTTRAIATVNTESALLIRYLDK